MGAGLRRVAKQCGGLTVTAGGGTVRYDADGQKEGQGMAEKRLKEIEADARIPDFPYDGNSPVILDLIAEVRRLRDDLKFAKSAAERAGRFIQREVKKTGLAIDDNERGAVLLGLREVANFSVE
jgi:hypothetical protein